MRTDNVTGPCSWQSLDGRTRDVAKENVASWRTYIGLLFAILTSPLSGQAQATTPTVVELELARHTAAEHVNANNRPFRWVSLDHKVSYDLSGNPNAYVFVFAKAQGRFQRAVDLQQHLVAGTNRSESRKQRTRNSTLQDKAEAAAEEEKLFAFADVATVITGATTESPLILRHFRGVPEFWVEAVKQDASRQAGASGRTQVIMVTPTDFRLATAEATPTAAAAAERGQAAERPLAASVETIGVYSKKIERISALRQQAQEVEARTRKRVESMAPEQRERHKAALQARNDFLRSQWDTKRTEWEHAKLQRENTR